MGWKRLLVVVEALVVLAAAVSETPAAAAAVGLPHCRDKCGNISIPYPFGIGDAGCFKQGFNLSCDDTAHPPKLLLDSEAIEVADIFLSGQLRVKVAKGLDCYNRSGVNTTTATQSINLDSRPFTFSETSNKFTVVGCDTISVISGNIDGSQYIGGCVSYCTSLEGIVNGTCSGLGCSQISIPRGIKSFTTILDTTFKYKKCWRFNPCGYAFLAEDAQYTFNTTDLSDPGFQRPFPIMLDWSIGNQTCKQVKSNKTAVYACRSQHSECADSPNGIGYVCNCSAGYQGNPYVQQGCQDIDECSDGVRYPCNGICNNIPGNYTCRCPRGTSSPDPKQERCLPRSPAISLSMKLVIGFGATFLLLLTVNSWAYWVFEKRKLVQLKHKFFKQNGGLFLQQHIAQGATTAFKIFTEAELAKATNNFDEAQVLGQGGQGTVYKGTLEDEREVAIKRSRTVDERQSKDFVREMLILSQINHKNIVKLLGCCLEVEVPMLVYEFISNGTLFDCIHQKMHWHASSLDIRLRIASEAAEALAYLHCYASPPILHGDVKSSNILLDDNYMAKVSDFGASILAPLDKEQFATVLQGTCGYLDPEYLVTCQLTEKSDVYSFGVVLVELLTGKKALRFEGPEEEKCLAMSFISAFKENRFIQMLEGQCMTSAKVGLLQAVTELANQCLCLKGEERPTMKEVALMLQGMRSLEKHPWVPRNQEEAAGLLSEASDSYNRDTTEYLNIRNRAMLHIEAGR